MRVGDIEIEVEAVRVAGTEPTSAASRATESVKDAFARAQETIIEVAKSTAEMIDRAGTAVRPDRVEVAFGLKFTAAGGVIIAGVAAEASLTVTLGYDVASRPAAAAPPGAAPPGAAPPGAAPPGAAPPGAAPPGAAPPGAVSGAGSP